MPSQNAVIFLCVTALSVIVNFTCFNSENVNNTESEESDLLIKLSQGVVKGKKLYSALTGKEFISYTGIPYAKAPVGNLRFKAPEPHEGWDGILDDTKANKACIHISLVNRSVAGDEDCLYVNVYIPEVVTEKTEPKSVMVNIHGGGFEYGSSDPDVNGPDYLINYDVIIVTFNYRLHIFGFLNLGIPECPGNAGLKDQTLALKWVKDNIGAFGGNPQSVTIFGESAGAASVHYQMISPLSKGLFQKAILQSGNALSGWALIRATVTEAIRKELFKISYVEDKENTTALVDSLKSMKAFELLHKAKEIESEISQNNAEILTILYFAPTIESVKDMAFLPDEVTVLAKQVEHIPVIAGVAENEYFMFAYGNLEFHYDLVNHKMSKVLDYYAQDIIKELEDENEIEIIADQVKQFYLKNETANKNTLNETIQLFGDFTFYRCLYLFLENFYQTSGYPVYVYTFNLNGDLNNRKLQFPDDRLVPTEEALHADELGYLFYSKVVPKEWLLKEENKEAINNICALWTNFAKTGNPNGPNVDVTWTPAKPSELSYLEIDEKLTNILERVNEPRISFWNNIKNTYSKA